jgi:hypothetical protein
LVGVGVLVGVLLWVLTSGVFVDVAVGVPAAVLVAGGLLCACTVCVTLGLA